MIIEARKTLANMLGGVPYVPARLNPPAIVVMPGTPYVRPANVFGHVTINWVASVVAGNAANEVSTDKLDDMIEDIVVKLTLNGYAYEVSDHKVYVANGAEYLAVDISITQDFRLGE